MLFVSPLTVCGQDKNDTIKEIDNLVLEINTRTNYLISTFYNEAFLDTGFINQKAKGYGQLSGYFNNDMICLIREVVGLELLHDVAVTEYYFKDRELIYINEKEKHGADVFIDSAGAFDYRVEESGFEIGYYFRNGRLIATIENGTRKTMLLPNEEYFDSQSKEGQLLSAAEKYYRRFNIKYKGMKKD